MEFLSPEFAPYVYKSTIQPCMQNTFVTYGLIPLVATWVCQIGYRNGYVGLLLLELPPLLNPWVIVEMQPAYAFSTDISLVDVHRNQLSWFHFLIFEGGLLVVLIDCMIFLSPFLDVKRMSIVNSFFPRTARPWNSVYRMLSFDL